VSATLLQRLALPDPSRLRALKKERFEQGLWQLFENLETLLIPLESLSDAEDSVDQPRDLVGSAATHENTRFKRRSVA
jgi:hypothetical protein